MQSLTTSPINQTHSDPFGMITFGRSWVAGSEYRYGFNGYETEEMVIVNNLNYDFGDRMYNTNIGRFFSVDSYTSIYSFQSPYTYNSNRPNVSVDFEGKGGPGIAGGQEMTAHNYSNNDYSGTTENIQAVNQIIIEIADLIKESSKDPLTFSISSSRITKDLDQPYGYLERGFMITQSGSTGNISTSEVKEGYADAGGSIELPDSYNSSIEDPLGIMHFHFLSEYQYQEAIKYECGGDCISDKSGLAPSANDILGVVPGFGYFDIYKNAFDKTAENGQFSIVYAEGKLYVLMVTDAYLYNKFAAENGSLSSRMLTIMGYSAGTLEERRETAVKATTTYNLSSGLILLETDLYNINLKLVK